MKRKGQGRKRKRRRRMKRRRRRRMKRRRRRMKSNMQGPQWPPAQAYTLVRAARFVHIMNHPVWPLTIKHPTPRVVVQDTRYIVVMTP